MTLFFPGNFPLKIADWKLPNQNRRSLCIIIPNFITLNNTLYTSYFKVKEFHWPIYNTWQITARNEIYFIRKIGGETRRSFVLIFFLLISFDFFSKCFSKIKHLFLTSMVLRLSYFCRLKNITLLLLKWTLYNGTSNHIYGRESESSFAQLDGQVHLQWPLPILPLGSKLSWLVDPPLIPENSYN